MLVAACILAAIAGWGAFEFSKRESLRLSRTKIAIAATLLVLSAAGIVASHWLPLMGEGLLAHAMLFLVLPLATVGAPVSAGAVVGIWLSMRRRRAA